MNLIVSKYADDTALAGLLQTSDPVSEAHYGLFKPGVTLVSLEINVAKTKELIFRSSKDGQHVEIVVDSQLCFSEKTEFVFKWCSRTSPQKTEQPWC